MTGSATSEDTLVLFVHGLGGQAQATWGLFPKLIKRDKHLKHVRTDHFSFPSSILSLPFVYKFSGINTLAQALETQLKYKCSKDESVILVCHSLGGLIAKQYLLDKHMKGENTPVKKVIFFAVPHNGAALASVGSFISWWNPQLRGLCRDSDMVTNISKSWQYFDIDKKILSRYVVAAQDKVVNESSSRSTWGNHNVDILPDRGHINCVKPRNANDLSYLILKNVVVNTVKEKSNRLPISGSEEPTVGTIQSVVGQTAETRVSISALIRAEYGGKYLLIRNIHRPESFAPLGGVYKFRRLSRRKLDDFSFRSESYVSEMNDDLRGYINSETLPEFKAWISSDQDRETAQECLERELHEELEEMNIRNPFQKGQISFEHLRTIVEGPKYFPSIGMDQYRMFGIYRFSDGKLSSEEVMRMLSELEAESDDLKWVTAEAAKRGRSPDGCVIGSHTPYLFGSTRYRDSDVPFG